MYKNRLILFSFLYIFFSISGCKKEPLINNTNNPLDGYSCENASETGIFSLFSQALIDCKKSAALDSPVILASFIEESREEKKTAVSHLFLDQTNNVQCAPNPLPLGLSGFHDNNKTWFLDKEPDYFVWIMDSNNSNERFYITDQSGIPLHSKVLTLTQEGESMAILILNVKLENDRSYYLYVKKDNNNSSENKRTGWYQSFKIRSKPAI